MAKSKKFGQRSFGSKVKSFFVRLGLFGAVVGGPVYYNYGTVRTDEVKVTDFDRTIKNEESGEWEPNPDLRVETTKGTFKNETAWLHGKFKKSADRIADNLSYNTTYEIKSYGGFLWDRNILSMREVTDEELEQRAEKNKAKTPEQQQQNNSSVKADANSAALSGNTTMIEITFDGKKVQMTVPSEVIDKITVNKITEVQPVQIVQPTPPKPN